MSIGAQHNDLHAIVDYVRRRVLPLSPPRQPIPFRGRVDLATESLPFFEDLDKALSATPGAIWNVMGPPGCGKTYLARWAAAQWGQRFLAAPDRSPAPLWIPAGGLGAAFTDDRALTGGPVGFALAVAGDFPGETPESLARLIARRPVIAILDKDEGERVPFHLELPVGLPPELRILHIAANDSLGGPCVRLGYWDLETALLAAHQRRGADGAHLVEALAAGPTGALAAYPWFVTWLLDQPHATRELAASPACVEEFLRHVWTLHGDGEEFEAWCRDLLLVRRGRGGAAPWLARRLLLAGADPEHARLAETLEAHVVPHALKAAGGVEVLLGRRIGEAELNVLRAQAPDDVKPSGSELLKLVRAAREDPEALVNAINICWCSGGQEVPRRALTGDLHGVVLPGHSFHRGLVGARLTGANLDGISTWKPFRDCSFIASTFREASLAGVRCVACHFRDCVFELADLSDSRFDDCTFESCSLADGIWGGAEFNRCVFWDGVVLASTQGGEPQRFSGCELRECDVSRAAAGGLLLRGRCKLRGITLAGLAIPALDAEGAELHKCDLIGLSSPGARLAGATLSACLLADAALRGADLSGATLDNVEFQPGPASRAGMTDEITRTDALHGSKSGFYADDISDAVYLDPDLVRTADLRDANLTGVKLVRTDLFRVDLRGAKLGPELLAAAKRMRAFVD